MKNIVGWLYKTFGIFPPKIVLDARGAAEWMAKALSMSGYKADFSLDSLREVDRFFDEHTSKGKACSGGLLAEQLGQRIFSIGAYIGEVIRRQAGGRWLGDDSDLQAEINLSLRLRKRTLIWPTQRAMKRFKNGPEDGIYIYAVMILGK